MKTIATAAVWYIEMLLREWILKILNTEKCFPFSFLVFIFLFDYMWEDAC